MNPSFILDRIRAKLQLQHDPRSPAAEQQKFVVTLLAPTCEVEQWKRWHRPQAYCRKHVDHAGGELWHCCRDRVSGDISFSFSHCSTATMFALSFRGL